MDKDSVQPRGRGRARGRARGQQQSDPAVYAESAQATPHSRPVQQSYPGGVMPGDGPAVGRARGRSRGISLVSQEQGGFAQSQRQDQYRSQQYQPTQQQYQPRQQQYQPRQQQYQPRQQQYQPRQQQYQPRQQQFQPRQQQYQPPRQQFPQQEAPQQLVSGRAYYRGSEKMSESRQAKQQRGGVQEMTTALGAVKIEDDNGNGTGNGHQNGSDEGEGTNGRPVGRGLMRGRRELGQIIWTKPQNITVKRGTVGQLLNVRANYFTLNKKQDWMLCLYHVYFSPDEDRTAERKRLIRQHSEALGGHYLFDGMQLYLPHKLGAEVTELSSKRESDGAMYQVKIKFIKELSTMDSQGLQIMNIKLRQWLEHLGLQIIGRNYFNPKAATRDERYKISIWPGYSTSVRQHEQSLLLNVDVVHKFLRTETAYDILRSCKTNIKVLAAKHLLGAVVMTTYNEKTYRIDDIDWNCNPSSTFSYKGGDCSYLQYYEQKYQVKIRDPRQPMLVSKPKKRDLRRGAGNIYLVPELCIMTGLTDDMRGDFNMMKDLAQYMRMAPDKRVQALIRFNRDLSSNPNVQKEMSHWGLQLSPQLVQVQSRLLPEEQILQDGKSISFNRKTSDWSRETRSLRLNTPVDLKNWAIIYPMKFNNDARELCNTLQRVGPPMGMSVGTPTVHGIQGDSAQEYVNALSNCTGKQIVLLILPNNRADRYGAIKRHASVRMGIASQCVLSRTLFKKQRLMSVATKIAVQMNCKLGGEPWNVAIPIKNAMVIGYDAYHDKATKGSSYGAVVSSVNQAWTRFLSQVGKHSNQEELTDNFACGVRNALNHYKNENGGQPAMVVVYRDGVGEGQLEYVKEHEIAAIKRCFDETCERQPKFAFVVVSKRITTRILFDNQGQPDNPPPGTVVDDVITLPERYDFFLVSQSVNQGTVSPTSFNVIEDTTGLKPDHMQRLAYKMTHLYYNWQGTVRVPAPCMYAHKLAFMTGQTVNSPAHQDLRDRLWYL